MRLSEFNELLQLIVGETVVQKTLSANSIVLWFGVDPKSSNAHGFWIDPPWRIETALGTESTSYGFSRDKNDDESEEEYRAEFLRACANSDCLNGAVLSSVVVDERTSDLTLGFSDGRVLRTFSVDLEYENWHYSDYGRRKQYRVWVQGVEVEELDA
jgi:hypothetical protein